MSSWLVMRSFIRGVSGFEVQVFRFLVQVACRSLFVPVFLVVAFVRTVSASIRTLSAAVQAV